jgi:hypothetical protein
MLSSPLVWCLLSAVCVLVGLAAVFPALLTPMTFDAPGPANSNAVGFAVSVAALPFFCLAGAVLPWILQHWWFAKWLFLLPLANLCVIACFVYALIHFHGGSFGPRPR